MKKKEKNKIWESREKVTNQYEKVRKNSKKKKKKKKQQNIELISLVTLSH